jgi:predicted nucleotide-binding protein
MLRREGEPARRHRAETALGRHVLTRGLWSAPIVLMGSDYEDRAPGLRVPPDTASAMLDDRLTIGEALRQRLRPGTHPDQAPEFRDWVAETAELIERVFTGTRYVDEFSDAGSPTVISPRARAPSAVERMPAKLDVLRRLMRAVPRISALASIGTTDPVDSTNPRMRPESTRDRRTVFVIHGRDEHAASEFSTYLRALDLQVLEWDQALRLTGEPSPYIGDVIDAALQTATALVVLFTGDEEARLHPALLNSGEPEEPLGLQPRPNVLFEAGMAMQGYRSRTILVELGPLRGLSDLAGRHAVRFDGSTERRHALAERLRLAGCSIDTSGKQWLSAGEFALPPRSPSVASRAGAADRVRRTIASLDARGFGEIFIDLGLIVSTRVVQIDGPADRKGSDVLAGLGLIERRSDPRPGQGHVGHWYMTPHGSAVLAELLEDAGRPIPRIQ